MQDLITISFPVYNVASTVSQSLVSALSQTYTNIEYLIVDDCGSDNSMDIVKDIVQNFGRKDAVKIVKHSANKGLGGVRNTSIEKASGKYIYFMDSDDILSVDCIEKLYKTMEKNEVDFVASSYAIVNEKGDVERIKSYGKNILIKSNENIVDYYYKEKGSIFVFMWNKLYSLAFINKHKIKCLHPIVEDDLFLFQVLLHSSSCCLIPDITYFYTINPVSITNTCMRNNISLAVSEIYIGIENYKYEVIKRNLFPKDLSVYVLLWVFTESIFRANAVNQSSAISLDNKQNVLMKLLFLPNIVLDWKTLRKMKCKFKMKLCLYKLFQVMNIKVRVLFVRLLVKIV